MEAIQILDAGLPAVLFVAVGVIWRQWMIDRAKMDAAAAKAYEAARADADRMARQASDLGKAADTVASVNQNGQRLSHIERKLDTLLARAS